MNYSIWSLIVMIAVFVSYVSYVWLKFGRQKSISMSYYALPKNRRPLFTLFCWGFSIPAIIAGETALMFLAGAGIAFVGAACQIRSAFVRRVHVTAAVFGIVAGELAIAVDFGMWPVVAAFAVASVVAGLADKKHCVWWTEIMAFISISVALAMKVLS